MKTLFYVAIFCAILWAVYYYGGGKIGGSEPEPPKEPTPPEPLKPAEDKKISVQQLISQMKGYKKFGIDIGQTMETEWSNIDQHLQKKGTYIKSINIY